MLRKQILTLRWIVESNSKLQLRNFNTKDFNVTYFPF